MNTTRVEGGTEFLDTMAQIDREQVFTPTTTVKVVVDLVPAEVWRSPATRILDPCTKGGEFLKECAKRLWTGLAGEMPDEAARRCHILDECALRGRDVEAHSRDEPADAVLLSAGEWRPQHRAVRGEPSREH